MFSNNKNKKIPNKKMQPVGQKYVVKRTSTRRLVKLERKNLNWSDEDIQRKQQDSLLPDSTAYETEKEEFSYRSPFEPINPPAKDYADDDIDEKDDIQDNINDEKKINDVNEEQKTQSPPRYKAKVIRKKKKKKAQDKNPTINT